MNLISTPTMMVSTKNSERFSSSNVSVLADFFLIWNKLESFWKRERQIKYIYLHAVGNPVEEIWIMIDVRDSSSLRVVPYLVWWFCVILEDKLS